MKSGKPLPTVKLDQFFNPITSTFSNNKNNNNNDSDMDTTSLNASSNDKANRKSIRLNSTSEISTNSENNYNSENSNGESNTSEFLKSINQNDKDKSLADDTEQKLNIKNSIPDEFQEIWRAVPRPTYAADVRHLFKLI